MTTRIKFKRDTAENWTSSNPILAAGETGFETDTRTIKIGDGVTAWVDLPYAVTGGLKVTDGVIHGDTSVSLSSGIGNRENWVLLTTALDNASNITSAYVDGVAYDSQGNAFTMGWYTAGPDGSGCYLQKVSPSGEVLFNQYYNEYYSYGFGMSVDSHDDVVMILSETDAPSNDIILAKISGVDGTIVWQKYINSYGDYNDYASCLDIDSQGDIFITGKSNNVGMDNNTAAYVAKFSGANGNLIWSKVYDLDGFDSSGTGLKVDKDGNLAVVGTVNWMSNFITVYKISGADGSIMWQGRVLNTKAPGGSNTASDPQYASVQSSDIACDSQGNFYFTFNTWSPYPYPGVICVVTKFNGSTGATMWARQLDWENYLVGVGSVICDDQDNVYVSSTLRRDVNRFDQNDTHRLTQNITKINATGTVIWQRFLMQEQAETIDAKETIQQDAFGQSIAIHGDYILVGGQYILQSRYSTDNQIWDAQPYIAQLNRDGGEFDTNGWKFVDATDSTESMFVSVITDPVDWVYNPSTVSDFNVTVTNGNLGMESNTDTTTLVYVNKSNVNTLTFAGKTLTLPAGGNIDISRETDGYFASIGKFYGHEGWNTDGRVWLNGSARDDAGNTYSAGGWYTYNTWNDWTSNQDIPMVFKTDSTGKLIWSAGGALDQNYSNADLVDTVYHPATNTVIVLGNDGEMDGTEGFNISYLDADTGSMKQDITHIRPDPNSSNDINPRTLNVLSDGQPVVGGYIGSARTSYADVTTGGAGETGSVTGTLVIPKTKFTVGGTTEYPMEDGTWYLYPSGVQIYSVNRYGHNDAYPTITYTGTLGSGLTVDVTISGGTATPVVNSSGSGYKAGQWVKLLGTDLGGASPDSDMYLTITSVDGGGAVTGLGGYWWSTTPADGSFTNVATTAQNGYGLQGWVRYDPASTSYAEFHIDTGGNYYGVNDTFKILGTALGGISPENDLTITVTAINDVGFGNGSIAAVAIDGTPQDMNIKLYTGDGTDYSQSGTYNVVHYTGADAFIWTPTWGYAFGSTGSGTNYYDSVYGVAIDSSDNVIAGGYADNTGLDSSTTVYNSYNQTGFITKFNSTGEIQWTKSLDGSEGNSTVWDVVTDTDDNIIAVMSSNSTSNDPYVTKLSPTGEFMWQQSVPVWDSNSWSIDVADNGDILIAGRCWIGDFNNSYHHNNWNILVVKFDKDGNKLFSRAIWSTNGVNTNDNDTYSNQLTIKGDRFSYVAYSNDPGNWDRCGLVVDLPLDGTGAGDYGDFHYEEIETDYGYRFNTNSWNGRALVTDITANIILRPYAFTDAPYIDNDGWRNVTIYGDRESQVQTVHKPEGGEIKGVAKIVFEDGSEQHTSMQGLPQVKWSQVNGGGNDYWLRPEDNGKHIQQNNSYAVLIPSRNRINLPVGYAITIINMSNNSGVVSEDNNENIYLSGDNGNSSYQYTIPSWTMATLVKLEDGKWMIAGAGITSGWY